MTANASVATPKPNVATTLRRWLISRKGLLALGGLALFFIPPAFITDQYLLDVLSQIGLFVLLGCGLNVVVALAGLLDLGYVAFWAVGAYTTAILASPQFNIHLPFIAIVPIALVVCAVFAIIIGLPTLRLRGDYLAIVTLGFGEIVRIALNNSTDLTGGATGIHAIDQATILGISIGTDLRVFYYVVAVSCLLVIVAGTRLKASGIGISWQALRDDELAARSSGLWPLMFYLLAFGIGAMSGGLSGVLFAYLQRAVSPDSFIVDQSFNILAIVVFAGLTGRFLPVIFAAFVVIGLPEFLRPLAELRLVVFGPMLVLAAFLSYHWPTISKLIEQRVRARRGWQPQQGDAIRIESLLEPEQSALATLGENEEPIIAEVEPLIDRPSRSHEGGTPVSEGAPEAAPSGAIRNRSADAPSGVLVIEGLSKRFGGVQAVKDLTVTAEPGIVVGLIGPNGAGKSTVFNLLTGVTRPDSGTATFSGRDLVGSRPDTIAALGVRRTFQNIRLFGRLAVEDNIALGCLRNAGFKAGEARSRARAIMEELGLSDVRNALPGDLPYAVQRRVEIARALVSDPGVLLLDEPAAGMDQVERRNLVALLKSISKSRVVLLVEHDMQVVADACHRVHVLDLGEVIFTGRPSGARSDPRVVEAYLGVA